MLENCGVWGSGLEMIKRRCPSSEPRRVQAWESVCSPISPESSCCAKSLPPAPASAGDRAPLNGAEGNPLNPVFVATKTGSRESSPCPSISLQTRPEKASIHSFTGRGLEFAAALDSGAGCPLGMGILKCGIA